MCFFETLPNRIIPDVAFGNETDKLFMMVLLGLGALSVKVKQWKVGRVLFASLQALGWNTSTAQ